MMAIAPQDEVFPSLSMPGKEEVHSPARWIWHPDALPGEASIVAFRRRFSVEQATILRIHVTADQRYELFIDGRRLGRGPHRSDLAHWFYETYEVELAAGEHLLAARTWWLPGEGAPMAQISAEPGFLLLAEGALAEELSTGAEGWEALAFEGYTGAPYRSSAYYVVGWTFTLDGTRYPWGWNDDPDAPGAWVPAAAGRMPVGGESNPYFNPETGRRVMENHLTPSMLPPMIEVTRQIGIVRHAEIRSPDVTAGPVQAAHHQSELVARWQEMLRGRGAVTVDPRTRLWLIIDLDDYYCFYLELVTSGGAGAQFILSWAESLYESDTGHDKGNRNAVEGKVFRGPQDRFILDGGEKRRYDTLWWRSGRYVEIVVETKDEAVTIEQLAWRETRYPFEMEGRIETDDARLDAVVPIMYRTLQMCAHETFMDCPYYEQLMYAGDTRLQALVAYMTSFDDRLPTLANAMFDWSRAPDGLTKSRYPSAVPQVIPPFSLWWVGMVYDHYLWRDRHDRVQSWLPGVDAVLAGFARYLKDDLVDGIPGWNFCDWVPAWRGGWPPDGEGASALINLIYAYALDRAAEMEQYFGQRDLAAHWRGLAGRVRRAVAATYWDEGRGMLADDVAHEHYSEHVQALAILTDTLDGPRRQRMIHGLLNDPDIQRTTIYFSHYLFEALQVIGETGRIYERLSLWLDLPDQGFRTTLESPEPSRSDCHAWGAHPIYHLYATFLGLRPAEPGFRSVRIAPRPGPLTRLRGALPHPSGQMIEFDLRIEGDALRGAVTLPTTLEGSLVWHDTTVPLRPGENTIVF